MNKWHVRKIDTIANTPTWLVWYEGEDLDQARMVKLFTRWELAMTYVEMMTYGPRLVAVQ